MDQEACYKVLANSDFGFVHQVLTFTREHQDSMTCSFENTKLNTDLPSLLTILTKYGQWYLNSEEFDRRYRQIMDRYYRFLARSLFRKRSRRFWEYHRNAMNYAGHPMNSLELARGLSLELGDLLLNPKVLIAKALGKA